MYNIKPHESINDFPWEISLSNRIQKMLEAKKNGIKVVVYLYEVSDTSTFRYRVYNMCQALELGLRWHGTYFFKNELKEIQHLIDQMDLLVIARFKWCRELEEMIRLLKKKKKKIAFDTDDLVYDTKYAPLIMNTLSVEESENRLEYWFSYIGRMEMSLKQCDAVITTNQYLADMIENDTKRRVYIANNFMNRMQLEVSKDYYAQKKNQCSVGKFIIGYFSGTPSHINDFRVVGPEIKRLLERNEDMILRIVGFMELPGYMQKLKEQGKVEYKPLVSFTELQYEIAQVDVNIAPLVYNMFTNCKSELKFFEAAVVGTPTCATPTHVFKKNIEHCVDGYLCMSGQWEDALQVLYDRRKKGYSELNDRAYKKCIEQYAYYNQVMKLEKIFDSIVGGQ
ncbi:MAG: glycosyltransferase [Lachnospiraceae bacterium]